MRWARKAGMLAMAVIVGVAALDAGPAGAQTLDEVIAKNLAARGGVEKLRSLQTVKITGVAEARGMELPIASWAMRPNKLRRDQKLPDRTISVGFDGSTVWTLDSAIGVAQAVTGPQADATRSDASFDPLLLSYKERGYKVDLIGNETLEGVQVHHLRVTKTTGQVEDHYLSADTGLEFRTVATIEQGGVKAELRTDLSDYRDVGGMQVAFSMRQLMNGNPVVHIRLKTIEFNVPLEAGIFQMPRSK